MRIAASGESQSEIGGIRAAARPIQPRTAAAAASASTGGSVASARTVAACARAAADAQEKAAAALVAAAALEGETAAAECIECTAAPGAM